MKKRRRRIYLTQAEKAVMWDRWKQGDSLHAIARLLDTSHTSIRRPTGSPIFASQNSGMHVPTCNLTPGVRQ